MRAHLTSGELNSQVGTGIGFSSSMTFGACQPLEGPQRVTRWDALFQVKERQHRNLLATAPSHAADLHRGYDRVPGLTVAPVG
jgi:hypothetical protein